MKNQREKGRLSQMFSGIEVLAIDPAAPTLDIQPESEIPPSEIAFSEESSWEYEISGLSAADDISPNPPEIEQQSSDVPSVAENDRIESADLDHKLEPIVEATLPLPDVSNAIPSTLTEQANPLIEMPNAHPHPRKSTAVRATRAGWLDVGIGALTGILVTGVILASTSQLDIFNNPGRFILLGWEVLSGILGASAWRSPKKTRQESLIGAIQWCLVPVWIGLFIGLMIYFLTFTNYFGK
jgi:hypothetical protein